MTVSDNEQKDLGAGGARQGQGVRVENYKFDEGGGGDDFRLNIRVRRG